MDVSVRVHVRRRLTSVGLCLHGGEQGGVESGLVVEFDLDVLIGHVHRRGLSAVAILEIDRNRLIHTGEAKSIRQFSESIDYNGSIT